MQPLSLDWWKEVQAEFAEEAAKLLLESPEKNTARLASLCPAKSENWTDAEDAEYEVEEDDA